MSTKTQPTTIFIVGPIGEKGSEIRQVADNLKNEIIVPAAEEAFGEHGFVVERADDISEPGRISLQVLERLVASDIAIVDLANLNPNVMYELGVRQARLKPYVLMRPDGQSLPFDIADMRAIDYDFTLPGGKKAIKSLVAMLKNCGESIAATDTLLFGSGESSGKQSTVEPWQQRIQVQMLDQLNIIKEGQDVLLSGVFQLMQHEERQRADAAEYRQQELGIRLMETIAGSNSEGMLALVQHLAGQGSATPDSAPVVTEPQPQNRQQRRAAEKKNRSS